MIKKIHSFEICIYSCNNLTLIEMCKIHKASYCITAFKRKISFLTKKLNIVLKGEFGQVLYLEHCILWLTDMVTKTTGAEVSEGLRIMVQEEN